MTWQPLHSENELDTIDQISSTQPVLLFKHSTRCSISTAALSRTERNWNAAIVGNMPCYYLDLLNYRPISTAIAQRYQIEHQSPQVLIIHHGKCIYHASHFDIQFAEIAQAVKSIA